MMGQQHQQHQQWRQLDLAVSERNAVKHGRLDPEICKELTRLLELLLGECVAGVATMKEASDE
jgi:hypothetical protein